MSTHEQVEQWCPHCLSQLTKVVATGFTFCPNIPECGYEVWETGLQPLDRSLMVIKSVAEIDKEIECASANLRALRTRRKQLVAVQDYDWRQLLASHLDAKVVGSIVCIPEDQIVAALDTTNEYPAMTINLWLGSKDVVERCGIWILLTDRQLDITGAPPVYAFIKLDSRGLLALMELECCTYTNLVIPC